MGAASGVVGLAAGIVACWTAAEARGATRLVSPQVQGPDVVAADLRREGGAWQAMAWDDLSGTSLEPGRYEVRVHVTAVGGGASVQVPPCAGRAAVRLDGRTIGEGPGPAIAPVDPGDHELVLQVDVSRYERRVACGERPRLGPATGARDGLGSLVFDSPHARAGGGKAVVYVPPGHDRSAPAALLVGLHPWNGTIWTYASYEELLREARARDVVLLLPSGLGNSLYTAAAEDEVFTAIAALESIVQIDPLRVSLWGASMGGAGATTIAFHHPDRFAGVTSFFGDSRYDLSTYARALLADERAAHLVNALDVVENARNLPVWSIHGEDDVTSPIRQSAMLASAMRQLGFQVRFDRVPGVGHAGALVARFASQVVDDAATARAARFPARVTYRSVRPSDLDAYGVHIERARPSGDAFVDVERRGDTVHVQRADGVRALVLAPGALGAQGESARLVVDNPRSADRVRVVWSGSSP